MVETKTSGRFEFTKQLNLPRCHLNNEALVRHFGHPFTRSRQSAAWKSPPLHFNWNHFRRRNFAPLWTKAAFRLRFLPRAEIIYQGASYDPPLNSLRRLRRRIGEAKRRNSQTIPGDKEELFLSARPGVFHRDPCADRYVCGTIPEKQRKSFPNAPNNLTHAQSLLLAPLHDRSRAAETRQDARNLHAGF